EVHKVGLAYLPMCYTVGTLRIDYRRKPALRIYYRHRGIWCRTTQTLGQVLQSHICRNAICSPHRVDTKQEMIRETSKFTRRRSRSPIEKEFGFPLVSFM